MANWYGACRSNYFRVRDLDAFKAWLVDFPAKLIVGLDGRFGFLSTDYYGGVPQDDERDIIDELHEYLAENEVAVVIVVGAEKARYLTGAAVAIAWTGEQVEIDLNDIYGLAQDEFGGDASITKAEY